MGSFLADTVPRPDPVTPGRYRSFLGEDWRAFYVFGGATMGAAMRAMGAHVDDPDLSAVSVHGIFLNPVEPGPLVLDVDSLRMGRSVHQVSAVLRSEGVESPALRVQGTWGRHEPDPVTGLGVSPPDVPGPHDDSVVPLAYDERFAHLPLHVHFDERACPGWGTPGAVLDQTEPPESAVWTRLVDGHRTDDGRFDAAVLAVLADRGPGPHLGRTLHPIDRVDIPARPMVTLDLALRCIAEPSSEWVLLHGLIVEAAERYVTIRVAMWDERLSLIAVADQTARFGGTPVTGP